MGNNISKKLGYLPEVDHNEIPISDRYTYKLNESFTAYAYVLVHIEKKVDNEWVETAYPKLFVQVNVPAGTTIYKHTDCIYKILSAAEFTITGVVGRNDEISPFTFLKGKILTNTNEDDSVMYGTHKAVSDITSNGKLFFL